MISIRRGMVLLSDVRQILFQIFHKWPNRQLSQTTIKPLINQLNYPKIEISQSEQLFPGNLCNLGLNSLIRHKRPCMIRCGNVTSCGKWSSGPWVRPVHRGEVSLVSWFMIQMCFFIFEVTLMCKFHHWYMCFYQNVLQKADFIYQMCEKLLLSSRVLSRISSVWTWKYEIHLNFCFWFQHDSLRIRVLGFRV